VRLDSRPPLTDRELRRRDEKKLLPPENVDPRELDREVRGELRSLSKETADAVARHLVAVGHLLDTDPEKALAHAYAARAHAARIGAVREAVGIAAYLSGEWQVAIAELRAVRRMSGHDEHLAIIADCERALGRPEKALELYRSPEAGQLATPERMELLIVAAGARRDLGQDEAALVMLQVTELEHNRPAQWLARLRYAYADALTAVGREEEARTWFARAAEADADEVTDAAERLLELDGVLIQDGGDFEEYDDFDDEYGDEDDEDDEDDADNETSPVVLESDEIGTAEAEADEAVVDEDEPVRPANDGPDSGAAVRDDGGGV
jgi:tetratricopeptide (TPR) repeat protein